LPQARVGNSRLTVAVFAADGCMGGAVLNHLVQFNIGVLTGLGSC